MNKSKFLTLVIIGLLISNGILLFMFIKGPKKHKEPKTIIIDKLHFNKEQIEYYEIYIQKHRKAINDNQAIMNKLRSDLYKQLKSNPLATNLDSLFLKIGKQQYIAEKINYNHFLEIKKMCNPSQQENFNELTNEIVNLFAPQERKE